MSPCWSCGLPAHCTGTKGQYRSVKVTAVQFGGMPRAGWKKPETERRLSDLVSVGVLTRVFPPELVDEVIAEVGRTEQRHRSLPARVMAYFSIGMALYSEGSYEDVLAQLTDGLSWASGWRERYSPPSKSAIFQARARLGAAPLKALFERVARPIGTDATPGVWLAGRRLVAIDGMCLDVADTRANADHFGRPGVNKGEQAAFPQARVVALAECGTHAVFAARIGTYAQSEATLAEQLLDRLEPAMLLTADRGFFSYALWRKATATGADLLWRIRTDTSGPKPTHVEALPDGSWLAHLRQTHSAAARRAEPMLVRVIDYTIDDGRQNPAADRLFTTLRLPPDHHGRDSPGRLDFLHRLLGQLNPVRRRRSAPRVIKRKYVKCHVKRAHHANVPRPEHPLIYAVLPI